MSKNRQSLLLAAAGAVVVTAAALPAQAAVARRPVDLVICLDTSGSMTALIDSARAKLWDIVNELAQAKPTPRLRVGLLTYGSPSNSRGENGWIVRQIGLTEDLDSVYARMMGMRTDGGDEFVGWVLSDALHTMDWSRDPDALRIIFVAGNESADQARDRYDFRHVGETARARGIFINAIYAGDHKQGVAENWPEVAIHGGGNYSAIDMVRGTMQISTPHDDLLYRLNIELNATYIPYGQAGDEGIRNQLAQDANAQQMGPQACASRSAAKGSALYLNRGWDLIDAVGTGDVNPAKLRDEDLPANMRAMTPQERTAYIAGMQKSRAAIQQQIQETAAARQAYLEAERRKATGPAGLDDAMLKALREQAKSKGFTFQCSVQAEL